MIEAERMIEYLTSDFRGNKYGKSVSRKVARDAVYRVRRVESLLRESIDSLMNRPNGGEALVDDRLRRASQKIGIGDSFSHSQHMLAVRYYIAYRSATATAQRSPSRKGKK